MKKRIISLLLTVVMLVSLCSGLTTGASAEANVTTVTMASGDTVLALCQKLGVDFYTYKNLIMTLNGFTSEGQFSKLAVGSKIVLPSSATAAAALAGGTPATNAAATNLAGTTSAPAATTLTAGGTSSIPSGDYVSYYLVTYTVQPGETISGIYSNWGLSYKTYDNQIKKLNNIVSYNSISAGKALLLPTTNPAMASSTYYTVMAHVMKAGETAYDIVCNNYGLSYSATQAMLIALNNVSDLSYIQAGRTLYIPVAGIVTASSVVSTTTSATTTTASVSTGAAYNLVSQTPVNGTFDLQVGGSSVTTAQAGKVVNVVAVPNTGFTVDSIKVVKVGDASASVGISGTSFTMPNYSVIVSVTFKAAKYYDINFTSNGNGSSAAMVNGAKVNGSYVGSTVTVKSTPDAGFMLKNIRVTYNGGKDSIAVYNNTFIMPDVEVEIISTFEKDPDYDPSKGYAIYSEVEHGTLETFVGNTKTNTAKYGDRVNFVVTPDKNYTVQKITVYYDNFNKTAEVDKNSFTMPDAPVTIVPTIKPTASAAFDITKVNSANGTFKTLVDSTEVSSAKVGAKVTVQGKPKASAYNYVVTVKETGGTRTSEVVANADGTSSFVMPEYPVSVSVKFYLYHKIILDPSNGEKGSFAVLAGKSQVSTCASGVQLGVTVWGVKSGYSASDIILTYANGSSYTLDGANFIMPDCDVRVKVNFRATQIITAHAITVNGGYGKFGNTYSVGGKTLNGNKAASVDLSAGIGGNVVINTFPAFGYEVDKITISYKDVTNTPVTKDVTINPVSKKYQFEMPEIAAGTKLDLYVSFKEIATYKVTCNYIEGYPAGESNASHEKGTFNVTTMDNSAFVDHAPQGTKIQIHCYPARGYKDDKANVKVINLNTGTEVEINKNDYTFIMPAAPVDVIVPFVRTAHYIKLERANQGIDGNPKGILSVIVNGVEYTDSQLIYLSGDDTNNNVPATFEPGTLVTVVNKSRDGYVLNSEQPIVVSKVVDGSLVPYATIDGDHFTFDMPNSDVIVRAQYIDEMVSIIAKPTENGSFSVPKQVAWNGKFEVSEIYPAEGFELDKIMVTYTSHDGTVHNNEIQHSTTIDLSAEEGMLRSDIAVQVTFKPALNPLTIHYIFDDEADKNSNYKVNLLVDGIAVQGVERGAFDFLDLFNAGGKYDDVLPKYVGDELTGYGIPTGKTVVIERNESKLDHNFNIVNIWVKYKNNGGEEVAIKPEFSNNQYYFKMPYIGTGDSENITLCIEYAKHTSDAYTLSAFKAAGDGEVSSWQFAVDGAYSNHTRVGSGPIQLYVTVPEYCEIVDNPDTPYDETIVIIRYTDSDGVAHPTEAELASYPATIKLEPTATPGVYVCEFDPSDDSYYPYITAMPSPATVTAEYQVQRKAYQITDENNVISGEPGVYILGAPADIVHLDYYVGGEKMLDKIKWGYPVSMTATPADGMKEVEDVMIFETDGGTLGDPVEVTKVGGMFEFIMPKSDIAVYVKTKEASSVLSVKVPAELTGLPIEKKIEVINGDGTVTEQTFSDFVALPEGTRFRLKLKAPGYDLGVPTLTDSDGNPVPEVDGVYTMPATSVLAEYTLATKVMKKLLVRKSEESAAIDETKLAWIVTNSLGTVTADQTTVDATIGYKDILTVSPIEGYSISNIVVNYLDINGNSGAADVQLNIDGAGTARVCILNELNTDVSQGVVVNITFKSIKTEFNVIGTINGVAQTDAGVAGEDPDGQAIRVTFNAGSGRQYKPEVTTGTNVTVYVDVRYYYDLKNSDISIISSDPENPVVVASSLTLSTPMNVNKTYKTYSFTFKMPKGDVMVNVPETSALSEPKTYTINGITTKHADDSNVTSSYPAELSEEIFPVYSPAPAGKEAKVVVSFKSESGSNVSYQLPLPATSFILEDIPSSGAQEHIPMGGYITVNVEYVTP